MFFVLLKKKSLTLLEEIYTMTVFSVYSLCQNINSFPDKYWDTSNFLSTENRYVKCMYLRIFIVEYLKKEWIFLRKRKNKYYLNV